MKCSTVSALEIEKHVTALQQIDKKTPKSNRGARSHVSRRTALGKTQLCDTRQNHFVNVRVDFMKPFHPHTHRDKPRWLVLQMLLQNLAKWVGFPSHHGIYKSVSNRADLSELASKEFHVLRWAFQQVENIFNVCPTHYLFLKKPKFNKVKFFLPFLKFMKRPQTKFHAHTKREVQVIRSKKSKFIIRSKFIVGSKVSCSTIFFSSSIFYWNYIFSLHRYFIETTTTYIDMFCKFSCNSVIIMGL